MKLKIFQEGRISYLSEGMNRCYSQYLGVAPTKCSVAEPGYGENTYYTSLSSPFLSNLYKEISESPYATRVFNCPQVGRDSFEIEVDLSPRAKTELELAFSKSRERADAEGQRLREKKEKERSQYAFRMAWKQALDDAKKILPSAIKGNYRGRPCNLTPTVLKDENGDVFPRVGVQWEKAILCAEFFHTVGNALDSGFRPEKTE